jgi:hypothetical protein
MAGSSKIEWCDATLFGAPLPRRCSLCRLVKNSSEFNCDRRVGTASLTSAEIATGRRQRTLRTTSNVPPPADSGKAGAAHALAGWNSEVNGGLCQDHRRAADRKRYRDDEAYRARRTESCYRCRDNAQRAPGTALRTLQNVARVTANASYGYFRLPMDDHRLPSNGSSSSTERVHALRSDCSLCLCERWRGASREDLPRLPTQPGQYGRPACLDGN